METQTIVYIIIAGIIALLLALFQYNYKTKRALKQNALFVFLRTMSLFLIFLLLINPKLEQTKVFTEKPNLVVAIDNSKSITHLKQDSNAKTVLNSIKQNKSLNEKFNIDFFTFGKNLNTSDSLSFNENQTNMSRVFSELSQIYKNTIAPTIVISDGNQNYGNDYVFASKKYKQPIYPIILGDTITYSDLKIKQLNVNKYAYLKNKFPVEAILVYNGNQSISSKFVVKSGNQTVFSEVVHFTKQNNSKILNITLPANQVGVKSYRAIVMPLKTEKNKVNNTKNFAVEVIDQKTNIAIVSDMLHPDIGMLKKSSISNQQRTVSLVSPSEALAKINDFQLFVLYQPTTNFKALIDGLNANNANRFIITGTKTDWHFLNTISQTVTQDITTQKEDYQAVLNTNYNTFIIDDIDFESFPPLQSKFGSAKFKVPYSTLLYKRVGNIDTEEPLLATLETNGRREAILFGENIWKWRAQSFLNKESFSTFDNFIGKLIQYLASNRRKNRLNVEYESFYQGNDNLIIKTQYFNKNYEFDATESLSVTIKDKASKAVKTLPFILRNNNYQVDLSGFPASEYAFTVKTKAENLSYSGQFKVLDYNIEQQFLNANVTKLQQLATNSEGTSYFISNYDSLVTNLQQDKRYLPIQKSTKNEVPLIDWKYLLFLIALSLAIEWFLRKYNGLI